MGKIVIPAALAFGVFVAFAGIGVATGNFEEAALVGGVLSVMLVILGSVVYMGRKA